MTPDISGYWHGVLDDGFAKATLIFELDAEGEVARLRTRTHGDLALPVEWRGERLVFEAPRVDIAVTLRLDTAAERLVGDCLHAATAFPVSFARGRPATKSQAPRRQTPAPPFPYETQAISFAARDGSHLAGTLTRPADRPARGAIVLSAWFGPVGRNQRTYGHQPMALWADVLTRSGWATLRYDKRGVGESSGDFNQATTADFAADLARAVAFLRTQPGIEPERVGLVGHSEGGHISADVAASDNRIAFCILLTPSGVPEEDTFETELFRAARIVGGTPLNAQLSIAVLRELSTACKASASGEEAAARTRAILLREGRFALELIEQRARMEAAPWRRCWLNYDHTRSMRALTCPTLVVFAGRDLQTPPSYHAPNVRAALAANPRARLVQLADLNHCLQRAKTGAPSEYGDIEETLAPEAVGTVCEWVSALKFEPA
jgi:hypothetical protein